MKHTHHTALCVHQPCGWLLRVCLILILAVAWLAPAAASAKFAEPDVPGDEYWADGFNAPGMNGFVYALAKGPDGSLYAGGSFTMAGLAAANQIARWDGTAWQSLDSRMNSSVFALAFGQDGSLYAGGRFTAAGGGSANRIARWDGAAWHPLGSGMSGGSPNQFIEVRSLAIGPDGSLYAGGLFDTAGGLVANGIARWDGAAWHSLGSGMGGGPYPPPYDPTVYALAFGPDGSLYVGGSFTEAGGVAANYIARWDGMAWHPLGSGMAGSGAPDTPTVFALAFGPDGSLYAGGGFTEAGGVVVNGIARWDQATSSWHSLGSGISGGGHYTEIDSLAFGKDGSLYAGGRFTVAGGMAANYIARWDGSTWQAIGSGMDTFVFALAFGADGNLYAGGRFIMAGGVVTGYIARWDQTTSAWHPFPPGSGMTGPVHALAVGPDGSLYAGGAFRTAGDVAAKDIARWDQATSTWQALGSGTDDSVRALAFGPDGSLYAGGHFTTIDGVVANHIARWDGSTWHPLGSGISGNSYPNMVYALAFGPDGSLYAGGRFTVAGGVTANYIARWDGIAWHPLDAGMGGYHPGSFPTVYELVIGPDGSLYAGGAFKTAGGEVVNGIARWDGSPWQPLGSGMGGSYPPNYPTVLALAFGPDGSLYAGGKFTEAGRVTANYIARWDGAAWHPLGSGMNDDSYPDYLVVSAITFGADGSLYAAGWFNSAGGVMANSIARWDGTSWHPLGSGLGYPGYSRVLTLALMPDGSLYVGGDFTTAGGKPSSHIARWATPNVVAPIERPRAGAFVTGTVVLSGFAIDLASTSGTGIDRVHIYLDGPFGTGTIIGGATYGLDRPDVAAQYGVRFGPSGWELAWDTSAIPPGVHTLTLYAHRTLDNRWSQMPPHLVVVRADHVIWLPLGGKN